MNKKIKYLCVLVIVLVCSLSSMVVAPVIPRGDSVEIRHSTTWSLNDVDNYLVNQDPDPAEPGGYVELRFKLENIGGDYARDMIFEIIPIYPFSLEQGDSARRKLGDMHMHQTGEDAYIVYYKLRVDKDAVEGKNPIKVRYSVDSGSTWSGKEFDVRIQTHDAILSDIDNACFILCDNSRDFQ